MRQYLLPDDLRPLEASFSPSGDLIILEVDTSTGTGEGQQATDIYRMRPDGHRLERVELDKGLKLSPQLSADGSKMLFWRAEKGRPDDHTDFNGMDV